MLEDSWPRRLLLVWFFFGPVRYENCLRRWCYLPSPLIRSINPIPYETIGLSCLTWFNQNAYNHFPNGLAHFSLLTQQANLGWGIPPFLLLPSSLFLATWLMVSTGGDHRERLSESLIWLFVHHAFWHLHFVKAPRCWRCAATDQDQTHFGLADWTGHVYPHYMEKDKQIRLVGWSELMFVSLRLNACTYAAFFASLNKRTVPVVSSCTCV